MYKKKQFPENRGRGIRVVGLIGLYVMGLVILALLVLVYVANPTAGFICTIFVTGIFLFCLMERIQRKISMNERLYLLLERFSDTVLFEYDCLQDQLLLTSNACRLFAVENVTLNSILARMDIPTIFSEDAAAVKGMLTGQIQDDNKEICVRFLRPDERAYFWCRIQFQYKYRHAKLISVIGKITDITQQREREEKWRNKAELDGLTRLLNKETAEQNIARLLQEERAGLVFMLDIDDFKRVNDEYGHFFGDRVLRMVSESMRKTFQPDAVLGRIGGDELIAFVSGVNDRMTARELALGFLGHLKEETGEGVPEVSVSIGIARSPVDGSVFSELYYAADQAMYLSKKRGKQGYCFYEELRAAVKK